MNHQIFRHPRRLVFLELLVLAGFGHLPAGRAQDAPQSRPAAAQVERIFSVASGYHELALLYIKKGDPDAAVSEARKIVQLRFPPEHEHLVAQSLAIIADKLGEARRFELAQGLLEDTYRSLELVGNRISVLLAKARLYKQAGDDNKAIETYKRATDLGASGVRGTAR